MLLFFCSIFPTEWQKNILTFISKSASRLPWNQTVTLNQIWALSPLIMVTRNTPHIWARPQVWPRTRASWWLAAQCSNLSSHRIGFSTSCCFSWSSLLTLLYSWMNQKRQTSGVRKNMAENKEKWWNRGCKSVRRHSKHDQLSLSVW